MYLFKNEKLNWDDLRLFLSVARSGGLTSSSAESGVSPATLGRRMLTLEQVLDSVLFERSAGGYELTQRGRELVSLAENLEQGAVDIDRWRCDSHSGQAVSVSAGTWTSLFLSRHATDITAVEDDVTLELLVGEADAKLAHRESNLAIRNHRPYRSNLSAQRLGEVVFAIYGSRKMAMENPEVFDERRYRHCQWLVYSSGGNPTPSAQWLERRLAKRAILTCNQPFPLLDAAVGCAGLCVLPCFIGDAESRLVRVSKTIDELTHRQWLISHDAERNNRAIKRIAKRIKLLMQQHSELLAGNRQQG